MLKCSSGGYGHGCVGQNELLMGALEDCSYGEHGSKRESRGVAVKGGGWSQAGHHWSGLLLQNWAITTYFPPCELIAICIHQAVLVPI